MNSNATRTMWIPAAAIVLVAAVFFIRGQAGADSPATPIERRFTTCYLAEPIGSAHTVRLVFTGGRGQLKLDPNVVTFDARGTVIEQTQKLVQSVAVELRDAGARADGGRLFDIEAREAETAMPPLRLALGVDLCGPNQLLVLDVGRTRAERIITLEFATGP